MQKRRLRKSVVYGLYVLGFMLLAGALYFIESLIPEESFNGIYDDYVNDTIFDTELPVIGGTDTIIRPYYDENINIIKNYYDYQGESSSQENSLIYFENTYLQNSGVSYGREDIFDVIAVYDGVVSSVREDQTLGKIVEITHSNDMISIYQSLSEVNVIENQEVKQGTTIGKSGTCNLEKDLNNHLHFELIINGLVVNPESYFDRKISEI